MLTCNVSQVPPEHLAVVVIGEPRDGQRHLGIAYRPAARAEPRFLHLAWHHTLKDDGAVGAKYRCVVLSGVPLALQPTIVAQCKRSAAADQTIGFPYGFGYEEATVTRDAATDRMLIEGASGLTCATFVLAILGLANVQLVDLSTWEGRDEDGDWKAWVVEQLEQSAASAAHVARVRADSDRTRVRPEDVAGAATEEEIPVSFQRASARGREVLTELR